MGFTLKKDEFSQARGSYSRIVNILCRKCKTLIAVYQKDGPGNLRRMYMDRIYDPLNLVKLKEKPIEKIPELKCHHCKRILGTPFFYEKDKRKTYRMYQDAVIKKTRKKS